MKIIKPSKRSRIDQLKSQADLNRKVSGSAFVAKRKSDNSQDDIGEALTAGVSTATPPVKQKVFDDYLLADMDATEILASDTSKTYSEVYAKGVHLLAMREHSVKELSDKLRSKLGISYGVDERQYDANVADLVLAVIDELLKNKLLSDERFTESYVRSRANRGFGPVKIRSELQTKGVSEILMDEYLQHNDAVWFDNAQSQYQKKYGDSSVTDYDAWSKRARFMQSRGFTMEHIHVVLPKKGH